MKRQPKERFEQSYMPEPNTGCWIWIATLQRQGYGVLSINCKTIRAHRLSYELHKGPIPLGLLACHSCDNRWCVNPDHIFLGTAKDNTTDMIKKNRNIKGQAHSWAKLTEQDIIDIRAMFNKNPDTNKTSVSKLYNVSCPHIHDIVKRRCWKHLNQKEYEFQRREHIADED